MDITKAMNVVAQVVRSYKGTADEHELLKASLERITELVNKGIKIEKLEKENKKSSANLEVK